MPRPSLQLHDPAYVRPVAARYVDPVEVIWLATATRLGLTIRRDPGIFSMTDGSGTLWFSTREHLDEDDNLAQMLFHELCHWITNGLHTFTERDWGFPLYDEEDVREHGCVRLQCWWASRHGLRAFFGPTSQYRQYYEQVPADPLEPLEDSDWERAVVACAAEAIRRAQGEPWWGPVDAALAATAQARALLAPFADDYRSEHEGDALPLLWTR
jgi:hypothetical protein